MKQGCSSTSLTCQLAFLLALQLVCNVSGVETNMIRNGLYSLIAVAIDGVDVEVGGVLILRDGQIHGGDSFVYYTGTYDSSDRKWKGEMISQEHTPTTRPAAERVQHIRIQRDLQRRGRRGRCHSRRW